MKKNLLKIGVLVSIASPLAFNLASCGPEVPPDSGDSSGVQAKYNCLEEAKKNSKLTVVNFWHSFSGPNEEAVVKVVDNFNDKFVTNESNPICVTPTATGKYEDTLNRVTAAINAGSGLPDLVTTYPDHVASYNAQKVMVNLEKFQKQDDLKLTDKDFNDFYPGYVEESYKYVFDDAQLKSYNETGRGGFYSLPINKSTEAMFYNKTFYDVFTKGTIEGVTVPAGPNGAQVPLKERAGIKSELGAKQYGDDMATKEDNKITVHYNGKTYTGFAWGKLVDQDKSEIDGLKHPDAIDETKPDTWWTFEDLKLQGAIYRAISKKFVDFETGKPFNTNIPNDANDKEIISKEGNFLLAYDSLDNLFVTTNVSAGSYTEIVKDGSSLKGNAIFNKDKNIKYFNDLRDLYKAGGINSAEGVTGSRYSNAAMEARQTIMSVGSTAGASHVIGSAQKGFFNAEVTTAPVWDNSTKDGKLNARIIQQGTNISMMAYKQFVNVDVSTTNDDPAAKKQRAAWEFMKYASSTEGSVIFSTSADYLPIRKSAFNDPKYQEHLANLDKGSSTALKAKTFRSAMAVAETGATYTDLPFPGSSNTRKDSKGIVQNVLSSATDVKTIIQEYLNKQNNAYQVF